MCYLITMKDIFQNANIVTYSIFIVLLWVWNSSIQFSSIDSQNNVKIIWILCTTLSFSILLGGIICGAIYWKYRKNALALCEIQKGMFNFVVVLLQSPIIFSSTFWFWWRKPLIWHVSYIMHSLETIFILSKYDN
jgi:hypothetical protein